MKNLLTLGSRAVLGGYLAVHGAQKLFGAFGGPGLEQAGAGFEHMGLTPGKQMAALAGGSELVGGALVAAGVADPLGPIAIAGSMAVASVVHAPQGPMGMKGGYEQAATNLAFAALLAASGPGRFSLGLKLPKWLTAASIAGAAALTGFSITQILRKRRAQPAAEVAADTTDATGTTDDAGTLGADAATADAALEATAGA